MTIYPKANNNKEYKVKVIRDNMVYMRELESGHLLKALLPDFVEELPRGKEYLGAIIGYPSS